MFLDNFNPLSPHGERQAYLILVDAVFAISIHSPHTGRDAESLISSGSLLHISIHSPHTGRDPSAASMLSRSSPFQSTLPTRGETQLVCNSLWDLVISIHSPHTGRDKFFWERNLRWEEFQSTLPTRGETRLRA